MDTYEPDIITTIEQTARQYVQAKHQMPSSVILSKKEYFAYKDAEKEGRIPKVQFHGGEVKVPVSPLW